MSVNLTDTGEFKPQRVFAELGHMKATKSLFEKVVARNYNDRDGNTALNVQHSKANYKSFLT
jgi:hypothetical protein